MSHCLHPPGGAMSLHSILTFIAPNAHSRARRPPRPHPITASPGSSCHRSSAVLVQGAQVPVGAVSWVQRARTASVCTAHTPTSDSACYVKCVWSV